jgi:hypothetical protein
MTETDEDMCNEIREILGEIEEIREHIYHLKNQESKEDPEIIIKSISDQIKIYEESGWIITQKLHYILGLLNNNGYAEALIKMDSLIKNFKKTYLIDEGCRIGGKRKLNRRKSKRRKSKRSRKSKRRHN